jgi:hypothetical protein
LSDYLQRVAVDFSLKSHRYLLKPAVALAYPCAFTPSLEGGLKILEFQLISPILKMARQIAYSVIAPFSSSKNEGKNSCIFLKNLLIPLVNYTGYSELNLW